MATLAEVAVRAGEAKKRHQVRADGYAAKLDGIEQREPEAFARADAVMDALSVDLDTMDTELRQLSNLPLAQ